MFCDEFSAQAYSSAVVSYSLVMSGQILAPFFFDTFPFIKVNRLGLGCAATIGPAPALTQLSVALSLSIHNTTATGALGLDAKSGVSALCRLLLKAAKLQRSWCCNGASLPISTGCHRCYRKSA